MSCHPLQRLLAVVCVLLLSANAWANGRPAASLLPDTTSGYVSVPNVERLLGDWDATQLGQLFQDKQLKPVLDQLLERVRDSGNGMEARFGLSLRDLRGVVGGELCFAAIEPAGPDTHATIVIADVAGRGKAMRAALEKLHGSLRARRATHQTQAVHGRQVTVYSVPGPHGPMTGYQICMIVHQNRLVMTDHLEAMRAVLARWENQKVPALDDSKAFQTVQQRTVLGSQFQPHVHWYVQPFSYARVLRSALGERKRGTDLLKILQAQGFAALQAVGGQIALRTADHEIVHRTMVYAPETRVLAARMLDFPNGSTMEPHDWVAGNTGTYVSFRWRMIDAFEHSETLVNALAGENFFDDFLQNLETDQNGPRVNLRRDLIAHLGGRITFVSDTVQPITPKSDRFLVAVEVTNTEAVARTVAQALQADPTARAHDLNGLTVWEIANQTADEDLDLTVEVEVEGAQFGFGSARREEEVVEEPQPSLPNSAIAVYDGMLLVSSHIESIAELVARRQQQSASDSLSESLHYTRVSAALTALGANDESFRMFSRSDETYRASYELIRQGRIGESESLVARLINRVHGEKGTAKRQQRIDGSQLPPFEHVSRYLGPAGAFVQTLDDGWMISGCLLAQEPVR